MQMKMLEEVEHDPTYSEEQRQLYRYKIRDLHKRQEKLKILSQNQKDIRIRVSRIKQTNGNVVDEYKFLTEKRCLWGRRNPCYF